MTATEENSLNDPMNPLQIPTLIISEDNDGPFDSGYDNFEKESRWTDTHRGPFLRVIGASSELVMTYKKPKRNYTESAALDHEGLFNSPESRPKDIGTEYHCEVLKPFSATPKCKQTQLVVLKNEGTTAIRYQMLRFPPSKAMRTMLENPRCFMNLKAPAGKEILTEDVPRTTTDNTFNTATTNTSSNSSLTDIQSSSISHYSTTSASEGELTQGQSSVAEKLTPQEIIGRKPNFLREASFDFHFQGMPGIILPGQTIELTIIFRPRAPGYCHENLYLLTHPRLSDESDKEYTVRLTGICMEPDCKKVCTDNNAMGKERLEPENVKRAVNKTLLELEGADLIDSFMEQALYTKPTEHICTLPFGKVTPELTFCTHNPDMYYHYGIAERALKTVQKLTRTLIPEERLELEDENVCSLSIKSLYFLLWGNYREDIIESRFRTTNIEKLLRTLAKCNRILSRPPIFAYTNLGSRKHLACQTNMMTVFDGILEKMDSIKEDFSAANNPLYKIERERLQMKFRKRKLKEHMYKKAHQERIAHCLEMESATGTNETVNSNVAEARELPILDETTNPPTGWNRAELLQEKQESAEMEIKPVPLNDLSLKTEDLEGEEETDIDQDGNTKLEDLEETADDKSAKGDTNEGLEEEVGPKKNTPRSKKRKDHKPEAPEKAGKTKKGKIDKHKENSTIVEAGKAVSVIGDDGVKHYENSDDNVEIPSEINTADEIIFVEEPEQVDEMLKRHTERKIKQARLVAFENMLGAGIEKMLSMVDTMTNLYDYQPSNYYL